MSYTPSYDRAIAAAAALMPLSEVVDENAVWRDRARRLFAYLLLVGWNRLGQSFSDTAMNAGVLHEFYLGAYAEPSDGATTFDRIFRLLLAARDELPPEAELALKQDLGYSARDHVGAIREVMSAVHACEDWNARSQIIARELERLHREVA